VEKTAPRPPSAPFCAQLISNKGLTRSGSPLHGVEVFRVGGITEEGLVTSSVPDVVIHAVVIDVVLPAGEPLRPGKSPAQVENALAGAISLHAEILRGRIPEPLDVLDGPADEIVAGLDPVAIIPWRSMRRRQLLSVR
jgi:hypothetical protein